MILVDTHILIWKALAPQRLSALTKQAIVQANNEDGILVCDISLWEIAMLVQKGRVRVDTDCHSFINLIIQANRCRICPITPQTAVLATQLPAPINSDPADCLIVATALIERVSLVTADRNLRAAGVVPVIW